MTEKLKHLTKSTGHWFVIITILLSIVCCNDKEPDGNEDCIHLGFAFYPGALISSNPDNYVNTYNSEIMLIHFGDNVPWNYLQQCEDLSCADQDFKDLMNALATHAAYHPGIVYLSVSPLSNDRNTPSNNWDNEPPPADNFADDGLRDLYKKWVDYLVDKLEPDYIFQGVEINMYYYDHPEDFANLISLLKEINQNTENVIGPSIQWEFYKQQINNGKTLNIPFDELGDGFAFSTYPHLFNPSSTAPVTAVHYDFESFGITVDKPLFIAECGIQHHLQESMLNTLFGLDHLEGVIWFFREDAEEYFSQLAGYPYTVFMNSGLYTDSGEKNPGADVWENAACK